MVILAVIATIIIAVAITTRMTDVGMDAQRLMEYTNSREANYQVARSAVEMGYEILRADNGNTDSVSDVWAVGELNLEWEGKRVTIEVKDEESKFPLSRMQSDPNHDTTLSEALVRFLDSAGMHNSEEARDQFLDYVDKDTITRPRGLETCYYSIDENPKNTPMLSIYELLALPAWSNLPMLPSPKSKSSLQASGITDPKLQSAANSANSNNPTYKVNSNQPQTQGGSETSKWEEWMSVNSTGQINVNTAPKQLLLCLDEAMSEVVVDEIDTKRRTDAFQSVNDLRNVAGMDSDLLFRIESYLCVKSQIFEVKATVHEYPGKVSLKTLVKRNGTSINVMRWEVQ